MSTVILCYSCVYSIMDSREFEWESQLRFCGSVQRMCAGTTVCGSFGYGCVYMVTER